MNKLVLLLLILGHPLYAMEQSDNNKKLNDDELYCITMLLALKKDSPLSCCLSPEEMCYQSLIAAWDKAKAKDIAVKQFISDVDSDIEETKSDQTQSPSLIEFHSCFVPRCKFQGDSSIVLNTHLKKDHNF